LGFKLGDSFVDAHGLAQGGEKHDKFPYKLVGILKPTGSVLDRLVLTDIETVRYVHAEQAKVEMVERGSTDEEQMAHAPDAATAIVASFRLPTAALLVERQIDAQEALTAANPSFEIARLLSYARPLTTAVTGFGLLLMGIAAVAARSAGWRP
jgi:putative ABC transport system permease protein